MKLPRDLSGDQLVKRLRSLGYRQTRQSGSHVRLTRTSEEGEHHITIPLHSSLRIGTLSAILSEVAGHLGLSRDELVRRIS